MLTLLLTLTLTTASTAQAGLLTQADRQPLDQAARRLDQAAAADRQSSDLDLGKRHLALCAGASEALAGLPLDSSARARLQAAVDAAAASRAAGALRAGHEALRADLLDLASDLQFKPVQEAPLPRGFPGFLAVDELELRDYPAYRMVKAPMRRGGANGSFWLLFQHIQRHDIAMTAPVQIDYAVNGKQTPREQSMAFLYGDAATGTKGLDGRVEVVDVPSTRVLSLGARGYERQDKVDALRARIEAFLRQNQGRYEAVGPMRLLNYNSPMVGEDRRYFEVQVPVREKPQTPEDAGKTV